MNKRFEQRQVHINGEVVATTAGTLQDLLIEAGYGDVKVATAVNGIFVPLRARANQTLDAGDHIEVVSARQGG